MKNASKTIKRPAAAGMLPADEQQGGYSQTEQGHQTLVLRGPSKKESKPAATAAPAPKNEAFSSPFGAAEDKARARGVHQQSMKDGSAFAPATGVKKEKAKSAAAKLSTPAPAEVKADDETILRTTLIMDIVYKFPEAVPVLTEAGLHCIGCQLSVYDDFQTGCAIHGFDDATINDLLVKMNQAVKEGRKNG